MQKRQKKTKQWRGVEKNFRRRSWEESRREKGEKVQEKKN